MNEQYKQQLTDIINLIYAVAQTPPDVAPGVDPESIKAKVWRLANPLLLEADKQLLATASDPNDKLLILNLILIERAANLEPGNLAAMVNELADDALAEKELETTRQHQVPPTSTIHQETLQRLAQLRTQIQANSPAAAELLDQTATQIATNLSQSDNPDLVTQTISHLHHTLQTANHVAPTTTSAEQASTLLAPLADAAVASNPALTNLKILLESQAPPDQASSLLIHKLVNPNLSLDQSQRMLDHVFRTLPTPKLPDLATHLSQFELHPSSPAALAEQALTCSYVAAGVSSVEAARGIVNQLRPLLPALTFLSHQARLPEADTQTNTRRVSQAFSQYHQVALSFLLQSPAAAYKTDIINLINSQSMVFTHGRPGNLMDYSFLSALHRSAFDPNNFPLQFPNYFSQASSPGFEYISFVAQPEISHISNQFVENSFTQFLSSDFGHKLLTPNLASQLLDSMRKKAAGNISQQAAATALSSATSEATTLVSRGILGTILPVIGTLIALAAPFIIKHFDKIAFFAAGLLTSGLTFMAGLTTTLPSLALSFTAGGSAAHLLRTGHIGRALQSPGELASRILQGATSLTVELSAPFLVIMLLLPVVITLILMIINNSAFLIPPSTNTSGQILVPGPGGGSYPYCWPLQTPSNVSGYWPRTPGTTHDGRNAIDLGGKGLGTEIFASHDGHIVFADFGNLANGYNGYGNVVHIHGDSGVDTFYAHLQQIVVSSGKDITAGTLVGYMGSTGNSTGAHLHYEIRPNSLEMGYYAPFGTSCERLHYSQAAGTGSVSGCQAQTDGAVDQEPTACHN